MAVVDRDDCNCNLPVELLSRTRIRVNAPTLVDSKDGLGMIDMRGGKHEEIIREEKSTELLGLGVFTNAAAQYIKQVMYMKS